jgi:cytoskeletal protein RodZ
MRLLKRSADSASKNIVLITNEAALLPLAGASGLHVAKNLQSKPEIPPSPVEAGSEKPAAPADPDAEVDADDAKLDHHRSIGALAAAIAIDEPETIPLEDADEEQTEAAAKSKKAPKDKKLKVPNFERFRLGLVLAAAGGAALIVFLILAMFVLPKATVTLQTEATPVSANFELDTSTKVTELDEKQGLIPAELKSTTLTSTQKVQATGEQNNGKKASGSVDMTARKCSGNPFDFPSDVAAGTGISTNGLFYITQQVTSFHGTGVDGGCYTYAANSSTSVIAQSAGTKYNVSGATFSVTGRSDVSATG